MTLRNGSSPCSIIFSSVAPIITDSEESAAPTVKFFQGIEIILIGPAVIGSAIRPVPDRYLACLLPFCLRRPGPSGSNLHFLLSIYHCSMTCISVSTPPPTTKPPPYFMLLIVFSNTFISIGFEIWAFIPAAREC